MRTASDGTASRAPRNNTAVRPTLRFRFELPALYTDDRRVLALAAQCLALAAAFQLFDGTQVVAAGTLRGMGRSDAAAVVNLVGHHGTTLPFAYALGLVRGHGPDGHLDGARRGLELVCGAMLVWVRRTAGRPLAALRVQLEARVS